MHARLTPPLRSTVRLNDSQYDDAGGVERRRLASWLAFALTAIVASAGCKVGIDPGADSGGTNSKDSTSFGDVAEGIPNYKTFERQALRDLWGGNLGQKPQSPTNRVAHNDRAAKFGHYLFYDKGLSGNGEVACVSCHSPDHGFASPTPIADQGVGETNRNAPTLLNVGYHDWYFWAGRSDSLWSQAVQPIENPIEMGGSRLEVAHHIYDTPKLKEAYEKIDAFEPLPDLSNTDRFPEEGRPVADPQTDEEKAHNQAWTSMTKVDRRTINQIMANVAKSIAAFELKLNSLDTPFDTYVEGVLKNKPELVDAISDKAEKGLRLFIGKAKCTACHDGPLFSTNGPKFFNLGLGPREWVEGEPDQGRWAALKKWKNDEFNAAGRYSDDQNSEKADLIDILYRSRKDKGAFKVPSLRGIEKTGPYMHAGHFETLAEVLDFYNKLEEEPQVGVRTKEVSPLDFSDRELEQLEAFLKTLDREGAIADKYKRQPSSPLP